MDHAKDHGYERGGFRFLALRREPRGFPSESIVQTIDVYQVGGAAVFLEPPAVPLSKVADLRSLSL